MATPHVAGTAALLLAQTPSSTVTDLKGAILDAADQKASLAGLVATGGRLNAAQALGGVVNPPSSPPPPAPVASDSSAPDTRITNRPKDKTKEKTATLEFTSNEPATFTCMVDGREQFKPCASPITVKVKKGKHTFQVQATDAAGNTDPTPAVDDWKVKKKKKK
jgi:hypothetical protein